MTAFVFALRFAAHSIGPTSLPQQPREKIRHTDFTVDHEKTVRMAPY